MGKRIIKNVSASWFNKDLIIKTFKERIDKLAKWATDGKDNKTLLDLVFYVFPFYKFATILKSIELIYKCGEKYSEDIWRLAVATVGREDDILHLIDCCADKNIDPSQIFELCRDSDPIEIIDNIILGKYQLDDNRAEIVKTIKLEMYKNFRFDFKECTDISNWVVSCLNQYAGISGINMFEQDNLSLPDNSIDLGFIPAIRESLFSKGYFLTFYSEETKVYCSICHIDDGGFIKIQRIEVKYDGDPVFILSKTKHYSLFGFTEWLEEFKGRKFNGKEDPDNFVLDYSGYYKDIYLIKILDKLGVTYINTGEYEPTHENIRLMKDYEAEYLNNEGTFVYIYPPEEGEISGTFEFKYKHEDKIIESTLDLDTDGNVMVISDNNIYTLEDFKLTIS